MNKKSKEIIGSPVISIAEGVQIGEVKGLVINPQQKAVEFLLLDEREGAREVKGIPFRVAEGVGEFAVTVEKSGFVLDMMKIGVLKEMVQQGVGITGTKVITRKGKYLGDVTEFSLNTESGELVEIYYKGEGEMEKALDAQKVVTIGKELIVVEDDAEGIGASPGAGLGQKKANFFPGDEGAPEIKEVLEKGQEQYSETSLQQEGETDPAEVFIQRQRQHLLGKTLLKDIKTDQGEVIAWENEVVTEELFNRVYRLGPQKLMELAMSVRD